MKDKTITLLKDSYTVIDALKTGGQGSIWKVRRRDGVELALKSVLTHRMRNHHKEYLPTDAIESNRKRIQSEIDFLTSLSKPEQIFVVPCLDSGFIEDEKFGDLPAWVMPFYPATLEHKMPPYPDDMTLPSVSECLGWIKQVAIALKATHAHTDGKHVFVHRDVKASNMMLTDRGEIRLIDFGIVHETRIDEDTRTHSYSAESGAPEQFLPIQINAGKNLYAIGSHSDIYGLGTVIYRLFTGEGATDAQERLNQEDIRTQHIKTLDDDNTGLLGQIGGLSTDEYKRLCNEIELRMGDAHVEVDDNATLISTVVSDLPNPKFIAIAIADFVRELLHPDYKKRPDAEKIIEWCEVLHSALNPTLDTLGLFVDEKSLNLNSPVKISVVAQGSGLSAHSDWINLSRDGKHLFRALEATTQNKQQFGFVTEQKSTWNAELAASQKAEAFSVYAEAVIAGRPVSDKLDIQINDSSEALWRAGKHQQALCIDLKDEWLDELQHSCETLEQATVYSNLLKTLNKCHPDKKATLSFRMQLLRDEFGRQKQVPKKFGKVVAMMALLITLAGAGAGYYWYDSLPDPIAEFEKIAEQEKISKLEHDLNSPLSGARSSAWRSLNTLLEEDTKLSAKAKKILADFKKSTLEMAQSNNPEQQKHSVPRLHLLANDGNAKAMLSLASAYQKGRGAKKNWGKTWKWYQKANEASKVNQLEQQANKILQNLQSNSSQRNLAYQVVEQAAKHQPAGDPAQKWMEYRYRKGDGVPVDMKKATEWKDKYENKKKP